MCVMCGRRIRSLTRRYSKKWVDKVYGDMLRRNPRLRKEKDMSKQVSFDFEDALAEREAIGIEQARLRALSKARLRH